MWILVGLLISFGLAVFVGKFLNWCGRKDYEALSEFHKAEGMPYRNSKGETVNAVWYCK